MLSEPQINEIREHLEKAQNPLFFYDNDADGLCSFLLLRRWLRRGKGVVVKSYPELNVSYMRKIHELKPDCIVILDKPLVAEKFLNEVKEMNLPIIWIDHHRGQQPEESLKDILYYNPLFSSAPSNEPVTYICYQIARNKADMWIAMTGCVGDAFNPDFLEEFKKKYPDCFEAASVTFGANAIFETKIGEIVRILNAALMDSTSNVLKMQKFLINANSPGDVLEENSKNSSMHKRFKEIDKKIRKLIEKAEENTDKKIIFFQYGGEFSISADIANELMYKYPDKIIVVAYKKDKGVKANISIRGKIDVREITVKALEGIEGATGGGHEHATGAQMPVDSLQKFMENFKKLVGA